MPRFTETKFHISPTTGVKDHFLVKAITFDDDKCLIETLGVKSAIQVANLLMVQKQRRFERNMTYDYSIELINDTPLMKVKGDFEAAIGALSSLDYISEMTYKTILSNEEVKKIIEISKNPQKQEQLKISPEHSPKKM